jgi:hypothetical protein
MKNRLLSSFLSMVALVAFLGLSAPMAVRADDTTQGKIVINVLDENGADYAGSWFLHIGSTAQYQVVTNGTKSYQFSASASEYFLEVRNTTDRSYYSIRSDNPQRLAAKGTITFNVQYFKTLTQMKAAAFLPYPGTTALAQPSAVTTTPSAPAVVTPSVPTVPSAPAVQPAPAPIVTPNVSAPVEPAVDETPAQEPTAPSQTQAAGNYDLATTGPAGMLFPIALLSVLAGVLACRKKNA